MLVANHSCPVQLNDVVCNGDISCYEVYRGCLRMDGQTLVNLEIFNNNADGGSSGPNFICSSLYSLYPSPFPFLENDRLISLQARCIITLTIA